MTKFEFHLSGHTFKILVNGLEQQFGAATNVVDLDYVSVRLAEYTLSYATDHGDTVLALLDVAPSWRIPEPLRACRRA